MTRSILCTLLIIIISCGNALARQTAATGNPKETAAPAAAIAPAAAGTISTEEETPATGNAPASEAAIPASEAAVPADGQKQLQALKAAEVQSPIRGKKQFLPTRRRIDREINKLKFAYKGEVIMGLTASYGTMSSDDTDIMLILDGIDADGTVATVKPFIGYFYRDNNCLGVRFGYRHMDGNLDAARYDLGESNDASGSIPKVNFNSDNYSFGIFHRSYAGLDPKGRFGLFAEFELSLSTKIPDGFFPSQSGVFQCFSVQLFRLERIHLEERKRRDPETNRTDRILNIRTAPQQALLAPHNDICFFGVCI